MRLEDLDASTDGRLWSPSAERNRQPIADVLSRVLPQPGIVLEVGSGTGQHAVHFGRVMPDLTWQPSEQDADCLRSISAWASIEALPNVRPPLYLDIADERWPIEAADAVVSINLIHIARWSATHALLRGASSILPAAGLLCLYGPYRVGGKHTSASNRAFDAQLQAVNAEWGVRDLDEVSNEANAGGLEFVRTFEMPANNLIVVFRNA
jgi:SAM-dependent methyltransferase